MTEQVERDWYFTFGHGQQFFGFYARIHGTFGSARDEMFRRFGAKWCMQYRNALDAGVDRWCLRELTPELEELARTYFIKPEKQEA